MGALALTALSALASCSDQLFTAPDVGETPTIDAPLSRDQMSVPLLVSDPVAGSGPASALAADRLRTGAASAGGATVVYVSLPPGSIPGGITANLRNRATGESLTVPIVDGGFDPVPLLASVGEEIALEVRGDTGVIATAIVKAPASRPPRVVRVNPPKGKRDVALNVRIVIVFSEPMDPATFAASVRLVRGNVAVTGSVTTEPPSLTVEFIPESPLAANTEYELTVTTGVRDLSGESLAEPVISDFTTGATIIQTGLDGVAIGAASASVAGNAHTCALTGAGVAYCWGQNFSGSTPTLVLGGHTFKSIGAGWVNTCAVASDGGGYCWGANWWGVLGNGTFCWPTSSSDQCVASVPVAVSGGLRFKVIQPGAYHACGLAESGVAYCWGGGAPGRGVASCPDQNPCGLTPTPLEGGHIFTTLSTADFYSCGIAEGGAGYCWGVQLGSRDGQGWRIDSVPAPVVPGQTLASIAAGSTHACAIATDGAAYCWGLNGEGQLGVASSETCSINDGTTPRDPEPCTLAPVRVSGGQVFASVTAGHSHTCALTLQGTAYCWGSNWGGQLGDGSNTASTTPVIVAGGLSFRALTAGFGYTCGVTTDATLYCWGANASGELGDGTTVSRSSPVRIAGPR